MATASRTRPPAGAKQNGIFQANIPQIDGRQVVDILFHVDILATCAGSNWGFSNQAKLVSKNVTTPRISDNDDGDGIFPEATASGPIASSGTSNLTAEKIASDPNGPPLSVNDTIRYVIRLTETGGCAATGATKAGMPMRRRTPTPAPRMGAKAGNSVKYRR